MRNVLRLAMLAWLVSWDVYAADLIECRFSTDDKVLIINGFEVTEMNWPTKYIGSLTFSLAGDDGVELLGSSDGLGHDVGLFSTLKYRFDGENYFGESIIEVRGDALQVRTTLSESQFLFFVSGHKGHSKQVVVGQSGCFSVKP